MADTVLVPKNRRAAMGKFMKALQHHSGSRSNLSRATKRIWVSASADPAVDAGSQAAYPVAAGDFAYRLDSDEPFVCTVAPTANTAATFVQLIA